MRKIIVIIAMLATVNLLHAQGLFNKIKSKVNSVTGKDSSHRVILNNKEVIIFLAVDFASGKLYLCQHDL